MFKKKNNGEISAAGFTQGLLKCSLSKTRVKKTLKLNPCLIPSSVSCYYCEPCTVGYYVLFSPLVGHRSEIKR